MQILKPHSQTSRVRNSGPSSPFFFFFFLAHVEWNIVVSVLRLIAIDIFNLFEN